MGKRHLSRFQACGVNFEKILDLDGLAWLNGPECAALLNKTSLDFAVVASPASTHYDYVKFFLERKIPVLVEKPLAETGEEAQELLRLAEENDVLLFVAQSECFNPLFLNFRKHFMLDLNRAATKKDGLDSDATENALDVKLEFRREHGYSERCRDVDVSLDLLVHDVSLFLTMFRYEDVVAEDSSADNSQDERRLVLNVVSGPYAGVVADFYVNRNSPRDVRTISVEFGGKKSLPGFDYSVSLARYTNEGQVAHIPDSLDNEHRFFLKLLGGGLGDWGRRAAHVAAHTVEMVTFRRK